ncbi:MAG: efflux RND transporter periplasmic adaptor subunit [Candidatus Omnitrophota bacterium]
MKKFIKTKRGLAAAVILIIVIAVLWARTGSSEKTEAVRLKPSYGKIKQMVSTTGFVKPQNRLVIKTSVPGRIEKIFFKEGDRVKAGDIIALLSSTERASLLDAAKLRDQETLAYWEEVYKPIPLVAPIDGEVIVRNFEPGQSVTVSDEVMVLSDRLVVVAQVDETDIGYVQAGQRAVVKLDAYPEIRVEGTVAHISFESLLVNNVTIYEVDIIPDEIPDVFRSGMSANADIIRAQKENSLMLPSHVIQSDGDGRPFVMVLRRGRKEEKAVLVTGLTDNESTEIVSGLNEDDVIIFVQESRDRLSKNENGRNPFMPNRRRQ